MFPQFTNDDGYVKIDLSSEEIEMGKYKLQDDWVLIRRDDDSTQYGEIIIVVNKTRKNRAVTGVVVQTGECIQVTKSKEGMNGAERCGVKGKFIVKSGDGVLFHALAGHDMLTNDGVRYVQCTEHDIHLVFENSEDRFEVERMKTKKREPLTTKHVEKVRK